MRNGDVFGLAPEAILVVAADRPEVAAERRKDLAAKVAIIVKAK